jgi:hypothetical protein
MSLFLEKVDRHPLEKFIGTPQKMEYVAETFDAVAIILDSTRNICGRMFHRAGPSENRAKT